MVLQRIDDNFDKLVSSVINNLDPEFPIKNKKELYQIATIDFLQIWNKIKKQKDPKLQKVALSRFKEIIEERKKILIRNKMMTPKSKGGKSN